MIYKLCKITITKGNYDSYEDMMKKLDIFYLGNKITEAQYKELIDLLKDKGK